MKISGRIDERARELAFIAPETAPEAIGQRLDLVERALGALETVCVPLALEVERAAVAIDTGMFREPPPDPPVLVYVESTLPAHLVVRPTVAQPPRAIRGAL